MASQANTGLGIHETRGRPERLAVLPRVGEERGRRTRHARQIPALVASRGGAVANITGWRCLLRLARHAKQCLGILTSIVAFLADSVILAFVYRRHRRGLPRGIITRFQLADTVAWIKSTDTASATTSVSQKTAVLISTRFAAAAVNEITASGGSACGHVRIWVHRTCNGGPLNSICSR